MQRESKYSSRDRGRGCKTASGLLRDYVVSLCCILSDTRVTKTSLDSREGEQTPLLDEGVTEKSSRDA